MLEKIEQRTSVILRMTLCLGMLVGMCMLSFSVRAETQSFAYLMTNSVSANLTRLHLINTSNSEQRFTGTLYNGSGAQVGPANTALHNGNLDPLERIILTPADLEAIFSTSAWSGPAVLKISASDSFKVLTKLRSPSGLISNTNCVTEGAVYNIEGRDTATRTFVRLFNEGDATLTNIRGTLTDTRGSVIGSANFTLVNQLAAKAAVFVNREDFESLSNATWSGEATLTITSESPNLKLINLNFVNEETFFNFSCFEGSADGNGSITTTIRAGQWTSSGGRDSASGGNPRVELIVAENTTIDVTIASSEDSYLFILDETGAIVSQDDDSAGDRNASISITLAAGTYTIVIATYSAGESGPFELAVTGSGLTVGEITTGGVTDWTLAGTVTDEQTGSAIAGARVKVEFVLEGTDSVFSTLTASDGTYSLDLVRNQIPDPFQVIVSATNYVPESKELSQGSSSAAVLSYSPSLTPIDDSVVVLEIDPSLHHLGDDSFSGSTNSQFQRSSEGSTYTREFVLNGAQLNAQSAVLDFQVKGSQCNGPVLINGTTLGTLPDSPSDGSFASISASVPMSLFRSGTNTITIQSVACAGSGSDLDDLEFVNLIIRFTL